MDAYGGKFPHLEHFLNAYMHQDWMLFGSSWQDVVKTYAQETSSDDLKNLRFEIDQFILSEGENIEPDYRPLYPNSLLPSPWRMTPQQWLRYFAKLAAHPDRPPLPPSTPHSDPN